jgi:hypothetical protein
MAYSRLHPEDNGPSNGPSAVQALERLADGAQGVIRDQLELTRIEAREAILGSLTGAAAALVGTIFFLIGWVALSVAAYALLVQRMIPPASAGVVAAVNLALGVAAAGWGITRMRNPRGV